MMINFIYIKIFYKKMEDTVFYKKIKLILTILKKQSGQRLDKTLAESFPDYSRSCIKKWIINQSVTINSIIINKPKTKVLESDIIIINTKIEIEQNLKPQDLPINIIYEDNDIIIINKSCNFVVHPGAGNKDGTILNALIHRYPTIISVPRAGIVHRLDKDTTGLMIVAKTTLAQKSLVLMIKKREVVREYEAITIGTMISGGTINKPISRHDIKRTCMTVKMTGKPAITHYRIIECFRAHTHLRVRLDTGRTHQIRVHMKYINHPLVGDVLYNYNYKNSSLPNVSDVLLSTLKNFKRPALHAIMLRLYHPISKVEMEFHAPVPKDLFSLLNILRIDKNNFINKKYL